MGETPGRREVMPDPLWFCKTKLSYKQRRDVRVSATLSVASCGSSYDGHTRSSCRPAHHNAHSSAAIFNRSLRRVCACALPLTTSYTFSLPGFFYRQRIHRVDFAAGFYAVFDTGGLVVGSLAENTRPCRGTSGCRDFSGELERFSGS